MKTVFHSASERGVGEHGWLHTRFSFSFADWFNPNRMGFGALRVLNDDIIEPEKGFDMHPHKDMEIITIVSEGAVAHRDSMGNAFTVSAGEVQVMSAGTGVVHAELNASRTERLTLFQLWIHPQITGVTPRYDQRAFRVSAKRTLLVSGDKGDGALFINQDARIYYANLASDELGSFEMVSSSHGAYFFVVDGKCMIAGSTLGPRDAAGVWDANKIEIHAEEDTRLLIIEVPME
jgi:redox-sensitive bicupin YhaK (pirin superfamily)